MAKVFLVTCGEYSDYSIIGAYSTEEKADVVSKLIRGSDVEEFELDLGYEEAVKGLKTWTIYMEKDGKVQHAEGEEFDPRIDTPIICSAYGNSAALMIFKCYAEDKTQAIKAANERRLIEIAEGRFK